MDSRERHLAYDPSSHSMRRELTMCQNCWKSKTPGVTMQKCSGCRVDIYCSRECQAAAWPAHKAKCKLMKQTRENMPQSMAPSVHALKAYAHKHAPTLTQCGGIALDLVVDPTRCLRDVLFIFLRPRANSRKAETAFSVISADVVPITSIPLLVSGVDLNQMAVQMEQENAVQRRKGLLGMFFCILASVGHQGVASPDAPGALGAGMHIVPVAFGRNGLEGYTAGEPWKDTLLTRLNEGIVL